MQRKATHPKAIRSAADIRRNLKKSPFYNVERTEFVPGPVQIKPGAFATFIALNFLLNAYAVAATGPAVTKQERARNADLVRVKELVTDNLHCTDRITQSFVDAANLSPTLLMRMLSVLSAPSSKYSTFTAEKIGKVWVHRSKDTYRLAISENGASRHKFSRPILKMQNVILHTSERCHSTSNDYPLDAPLFPVTESGIAAYHAALEKGDERILEFSKLLHEFKTQLFNEGIIQSKDLTDVSQHLPRLRKLVVQHKHGASAITNSNLDKLELYFNATKGCLTNMNHAMMTAEEYQGGSRHHHIQGDVFYNVKIGCPMRQLHMKLVNSELGRDVIEIESAYLHPYDSVAQLVYDVTHHRVRCVKDYSDLQMHSNQYESAYKLTERFTETIHSLSEEAVHVFYPEVEQLMAREKALCEDDSSYSFRSEL